MKFRPENRSRSNPKQTAKTIASTLYDKYKLNPFGFNLFLKYLSTEFVKNQHEISMLADVETQKTSARICSLLLIKE